MIPTYQTGNSDPAVKPLSKSGFISAGNAVSVAATIARQNAANTNAGQYARENVKRRPYSERLFSLGLLAASTGMSFN